MMLLVIVLLLSAVIIVLGIAEEVARVGVGARTTKLEEDSNTVAAPSVLSVVGVGVDEMEVSAEVEEAKVTVTGIEAAFADNDDDDAAADEKDPLFPAAFAAAAANEFAGVTKEDTLMAGEMVGVADKGEDKPPEEEDEEEVVVVVAEEMDNEPKRTTGDTLAAVIGAANTPAPPGQETKVVVALLVVVVVDDNEEPSPDNPRRVCKFFFAISAFNTHPRSVSTLRPNSKSRASKASFLVRNLANPI